MPGEHESRDLENSLKNDQRMKFIEKSAILFQNRIGTIRSNSVARGKNFFCLKQKIFSVIHKFHIS